MANCDIFCGSEVMVYIWSFLENFEKQGVADPPPNFDKRRKLEKNLNDNKNKWKLLKKVCEKDTSSTPYEISKKDVKVTRKLKKSVK